MGKAKVDLVTVAKPEKKKSLLEKYDIPIEHLSYEYINESKEVKELERIVLILRSGEEGSYPDLTKHAEKRLAAIKPESTILRVSEPVLTKEMLAPERRQKLENDMNQWMNDMKLREKDLEAGRSMQISEPVPQPDIRKITFNENKNKRQILRNQNNNKRISSCDYAAWDKYDADTELNRIDLQNEKKQADIKRTQQKLREKEEKVKKTSRKAIVNNLTLTGTEYNIMAEEERKKGNEAFKAGDYEEALQFYDLSIAIDASNEAYNNRAITFIKLRRYIDAVNDCNRVISAEPMNIKALLRRALALEHLEKKSQALADYEAILKLEPTNKIAIAAINKLRAPCNSKKITMKIEEVSNTEEISTLKPSEIQKTVTNNFSQAKSNLDPKKSEKKLITDINEVFTPSNKFSTISGHNSTSSKKSSNQIQPQVCFCNNAPSSSQHISPFPHMKNIYCSKNFEKSSGLKKAQSIFTNTKMSSDKSSGVIIEEIPNETLEESVNKFNNKVIKKSEEKNSKIILGSGDNPNNITKKSSELKEDTVKNKNKIKEDIKKNINFDKLSSGVIIKEIPNESLEKPFEKSNNKKSNDLVTTKSNENNSMTILGSGDNPKNIAKKFSELKEDIPKNKNKIKEDITKNINFDKISSGVIIEKIPNKSFEKPFKNFDDKKINNPGTKKSEEKNSMTILDSGEKPKNEAKNKSPKLEKKILKNKIDIKEDITKNINFDKIQNESYEKSVKEFNNKKSNDKATKLDDKNMIKIFGSDDNLNNKIEEITEKAIKKDIMKDIKFDKISTPYEFLKVWHSLKNDYDQILRAKLLLILTPENIPTVIGNKLDGDMLAIILRCFKKHFCIPEKSKMLHQFLQNLTKVERFSMICMFMNDEDKKVLHDILLFLETQNSDPETIQNICKAYGISM